MDKKKTLLHVLLAWAKEKEPDILKIDVDLVHATEASQWGLPDLKNQARRDAVALTAPGMSWARRRRAGLFGLDAFFSFFLLRLG